MGRLLKEVHVLHRYPFLREHALKGRRRAFPAEDSSRLGVDLPVDSLRLVPAYLPDVRSLLHVSPYQPVAVLVASSVPGTVRTSEVGLDREQPLPLLPERELRPVVERHAAEPPPEGRMAGLVGDKGREDVRCLLAPDRYPDKEPRPPLDQGQVRASYPVLRAYDEVSLPMSERLPRSYLLRALRDRRPSGLSVGVRLPFLPRLPGLSARKVHGPYPVQEPFPAVGVQRLDADGRAGVSCAPYGMPCLLERPQHPVLPHVVRDEPEEAGRLLRLAGVPAAVPLPERLSRGEDGGDMALLAPLPGGAQGLYPGFPVQAVARGYGASGLACDSLHLLKGPSFRPVHRRHHFRDLLSPEVLEPSPFLPYNLFRHRHVLSDV